MTFSQFSIFLQRLESTPSRLEITRILAELFKTSSPDEIDKICYLALGGLAPNYKGIVFNMADKLVIQAVAKAYGSEVEDVVREYKVKGDLGIVTELLAQETINRKQKTNSSVDEVYDVLYKIAVDEGGGSVERKIDKLAELLKSVDPLSARYLARIPVGKLRLGFSDKTIIDALSWMETGGKSESKKIEEAYNILPDVGLLAKSVKLRGIDETCKNVTPVVGVPVLPMLGQRIKSPAEMIEKMGKVAIEPKFDGLRVLIHYKSSKLKTQNSKQKLKIQNNEETKHANHEQTNVFIKAFTRNSNDVTEMFPELSEIGKYVNCSEVILDSEAVGMDPEMKKFADFQTTMKRRRVHQISVTCEAVPLSFQVFDVLYCDGKNMMNEPYYKRRKLLENIISKENNLLVVDAMVVTEDPEVINNEYRKKIKDGLEGIFIKKYDSKYVSGRTGWRWVKMKQGEEAVGKLSDTVDCVVMGYTVGKGKRASFGLGQFLVGVVDPPSRKATVGEGRILTLTKIGTGLTDEEFRELAIRLKRLEVREKPKEYEAHKNYTPDFWVEPKFVVELAGDDLTKSPIHTSGYALRFPRLVKFREDKSVKEATTLQEIKMLFGLQGR